MEMEDGGRVCLIFHHISYDTPLRRFLLSAVIACMIIRWTGQPRSEHWEVLESRIMDVWQAGKSWLDLQFDNEVLFAFLGMIFSLDCADGVATDVTL